MFNSCERQTCSMSGLLHAMVREILFRWYRFLGDTVVVEKFPELSGCIELVPASFAERLPGNTRVMECPHDRQSIFLGHGVI